MLLLSEMHRNGDGVEADLGEAYFWAFIAAQNGMQGARDAVRELADQVTTEDRMAAEQRAIEFVPKRPQPR